MIFFFKSWCEEIIVAVIISIIIESILPEGNNKKYVKVVIGIYILFVIVNPIIQNINSEINFEYFTNYKSIETSTVIDDNIKEVYIKGMEENLKEEIEKLGFKVIYIDITVDNNYENIEKIEIIVNKNGVTDIGKVVIGQDNVIDNSNYFVELKKYISNNYNIDINKIIIKS